MKIVGRPFTKNRQAGFSLVELMIVVAIIGILAALAVPRFQSFQAKARQSEAKNNLTHVYTLQMSFYGDNDAYGTVPKTGRTGICPGQNEIGFRVTPCDDGRKKIRYTYESAPSATGFNGTAIAPVNVIVAGCNIADSWQINEDKFLRSGPDAVKDCDK